MSLFSATSAPHPSRRTFGESRVHLCFIFKLSCAPQISRGTSSTVAVGSVAMTVTTMDDVRIAELIWNVSFRPLNGRMRQIPVGERTDSDLCGGPILSPPQLVSRQRQTHLGMERHQTMIPRNTTTPTGHDEPTQWCDMKQCNTKAPKPTARHPNMWPQRIELPAYSHPSRGTSDGVNKQARFDQCVRNRPRPRPHFLVVTDHETVHLFRVSKETVVEQPQNQ